jgi:AcrR family transcriptional regulator
MSRGSKSNGLNPRKTATQARATKTVEAIVEAAARILETAGLDGYTTNAVAERAGVSIGSLYQYFPNKDAITLALIARESTALLQEVSEAAAETEWNAALDKLVGAAVRHQLRRPALARLLDVEEARLPARDETTPGSGAIYSIVREVVSRIAPGGGPDIDQRAGDVIGMTRGMTDMAGRRHEVDSDDLAARVSRAILGYLFSAATSNDKRKAAVGNNGDTHLRPI